MANFGLHGFCQEIRALEVALPSLHRVDIGMGMGKATHKAPFLHCAVMDQLLLEKAST
jgi:hypothetical protein